MIRLSPPIARLVAIGLLLLIPALIHTLVVVPLWEHYQTSSERVGMLRQVVERGLGAERQRAELVAQLRELRARPDSGGDFLPGDNEAVIGADLQDRIKQLVDSARGDLSSTQVLPGREEGPFRRVSVRVQVAMEAAGLQQLIYDLEAQVPYLFVDNLRIRAPVARVTAQRGAGGAGDAGAEEKLVIVFDVHGYIRATK